METNRPKVKLCGQTRPDDIRFSFESGADFCGVVVQVPSSRRTMTVEQASPLFKEYAPRMFALTANADMELYAQIAARLKPGFFQLTANETPEETAKVRDTFGIPVFKSLHLPEQGGQPDKSVETFLALMKSYLDGGCDGFVLDTQVHGMFGGSGRQSDWRLAKEIISRTKAKTFIAGGISPENAAQAAALGAYGIDLASGVETSPGIKSEEKMTALFTALRKGEK